MVNISEEKLEFYKKNYFEFIRDELVNLKVTPFQKNVLEKASKYRARVAIHGGRGVGKSYLMAMLIITLLCLHEEITITILAGKIKTTKDSIWRAVKNIHGSLPDKYKNILNVPLEEKMTRKPRRGTAITASADIVGYQDGNEITIQGRHSENLFLIVDEASLVSNRAMDVLYFSMTQGNNKMVLLGNPNKSSGYFYDTHYHRTKSKLWDKIVISTYEAAGVEKIIKSDGSYSYKDLWDGEDFYRPVALEFLHEVETQYAENSDDRRVYVYGLPPLKSEDALFSADQIKSFENRFDKNLYRLGNVIAGIVVGDSSFPTVISYRWRNICFKEDVLFSWDMKEIIKWAREKLKKVRVEDVIVSFSSLTMYSKDAWLDIGDYPVCFADELEVETEFRNHRSLAYQNMQKWIYNYSEEISINDLDVIDNLCCIEGKFNGIGRITIEDHNHFKDKNGLSYNYCEALSNTFLIDYTWKTSNDDLWWN